MILNKIIVTGGAGFIGSHLCKALIERKYNVICVDNLITGSKKNIESLLTNPSFEFIKHDITVDFQKIVPKLEKVKQIYHLASPASPVQYQKHPLETSLVNSFGTYYLLKLAYVTGAKFLYASTSEVYGDPKEHPQKETYWGNVNSFGPRSCYDEAKRFGEALIYTFVHQFKVDARIVRIFNTYGPNMEKDDGRIISNLVNQAIKNQSLTIYGDGKQTRSFCFVDDMVSGLIKAMETDGTKGEIINLGNPDERSVMEIAKLILALSHSKAEIIYQNLPEDDPLRRRPDIAKAQKLLDWQPQVKLEEGLKKTIAYFRNLQ